MSDKPKPERDARLDTLVEWLRRYGPRGADVAADEIVALRADLSAARAEIERKDAVLKEVLTLVARSDKRYTFMYDLLADLDATHSPPPASSRGLIGKVIDEFDRIVHPGASSPAPAGKETQD